MYNYRSLAALALVATAAACSSTDATRPGLDASDLTSVASLYSAGSASSITISPATATVAAGANITLSGAIKSATGADLTATLGAQVILASSDTTVAKVSKTGVVTGIRNGVATVTAKLGTLSSKSTITVGTGLSSTAPSSITITPATATVSVGATLALSGSVKSATGVDMTATLAAQISLTSSDTTVAKVSSMGVVTGLRNGVATVTAQIGTLSSKSTITVGTGSASTAPTPPPVLPTPPTPLPPSGGSPVSAMALVSDNYSGYASTQDLMANISTSIGGTGSPSTALYTDGANASLASLDKTVMYNGHATVKYNQPGGVAATPELWARFPGNQTLKKLWLRVKVRFSPGFTTTGTQANSANAYKLLGWTWNTYDGSGRVEISNTTQYQLYWNALAKSTGASVGGGNYGMGGNISTEWSDGGWYDYILEVDFSQASGVTRLWRAKDGQTPVLAATSTGTMASGATLPQLTSVMLGLNFNQMRAAAQSQALWIGQWEVIDGAKYANPYNIPGM